MFSLHRTTSQIFVFLMVLVPTNLWAADRDCPLPGQKDGLSVKLYFGQSLANGRTIPPTEWQHFLSRVVTPRFPDGLTVYDAYGQWKDIRTHVLSHEHTKVVEIFAPNTAVARPAILDIVRAYRKLFHQQSVGIVTGTNCWMF